MPKLEDLPLEIILEILSYNSIAHSRRPTAIHPLNAIAGTNKHLYAVVEEYTRGLLKRYGNYTPPKPNKNFSYRKKWLGATCQFCKRASQRRAILYSTLTCCRLCDKQYFPKMTMTQASKTHSLSKLDLFTPNALHPNLPPLTIGIYMVLGNAATMILESDVLARKAHIQALVGPKADMHLRPGTHERIINHLGMYFCPYRGAWKKAPVMTPAALEKATKSMKSEEGRREYVKAALEKEWAVMGVGKEGTKDEPIQVDD